MFTHFDDAKWKGNGDIEGETALIVLREMWNHSDGDSGGEISFDCINKICIDRV